VADLSRGDRRREREGSPRRRKDRHVLGLEGAGGEAGTRVEDLDERNRGRGRHEVAQLRVERELVRLAHVTGVDDRLLEHVGLDLVANVVVAVVVVVVDDELLRALGRAAFAGRDRAECRTAVRRGEGEVVVEEGRSRRVEDICSDEPAVVAEGRGAGHVQPFEVLAVEGDLGVREARKSQRRHGSEECAH